jgi:YVTN family beta-propeller protein
VSINDESGDTTRCLLLASPDEPRIVNQQGLEDHLSRAFAGRPVLAIDVGKDTISVIDLKNNAVITSVGVAQVTATPET